MSEEKQEKPEVELIELSLRPEALDDEEREDASQAYKIAAWVMENTEAGFVIIGSPLMEETPSGLLYPSSIGIVMNDQIGITKTILANILKEVAYQLNTDMRNLEKFLRDAELWGKDKK